MRHFKNISWLFGEKVLRIILGLFVSVWVARYLGAERFGLFSYVQSLVEIFAIVATLGVDSIIVKALVKNKKIAYELVGTAFWLKLIGAFLFLIFLIVVMSMISTDTYLNTLVLIVASATIFKSFSVINAYFQSKVMNKYMVYARSISLVVATILKIILILVKAPLIAFVWIIVFENFTTACGFVYYFFTRSEFQIQYLKFRKRIALTLLKRGWPFILSGIAVGIYMKIDQVMIRAFLGNEAVGQYAVATKLSEVWYFLPMIITTSLFPAIINAKKVSTTLYKERLQSLYDLMTWMAIAIALFMTLMGNWIVDLLYGEQYHQAGGVLVIHVWAGVFAFLGVACSKYLINENLITKALFITMSGMVTNVLLNYILIPIYGIQGAAVATLLGQIVSNYLYDLSDKSLHEQFMMKTKSFYPIHIFKKYIKSDFSSR